MPTHTDAHEALGIALANACLIDYPPRVYHSEHRRRYGNTVGVCEQASDIMRDVIYEDDENADAESLTSTVVTRTVSKQRADVDLESGGDQEQKPRLFIAYLKAIVAFPACVFLAMRQCVSGRV